MENQRQKVSKDGSKLLPPKMFRRMDRTKKHQGVKYNNNRTIVGSSKFIVGFGNIWNSGAIYDPRRKKLKGWQKENRKYKQAS
jgi:hypothetical protein